MFKRMLSLLLICLLLTGCGQRYDGETVEKQVVTSMTSESWFDGIFDQIHTTSVREYGYDEFGRRTYEKWISNGETVSSSRYFWSSDGRECTEISIDHQGLIPWPYARVKEVYDETGNEVERVVYEFFSVTQRSLRNYDDAGNLIRLEILNGDGSLSALQEYTYDDNGNRLKTIDITDPGKERVTEYTYDDSGNETGWYYYENGSLSEYVETRYDDQGRQTFSARYNGLGEQQHYWEYTYSADGSSMTTTYSGSKSTIEYYDGSELPVRIEQYDEDGTLNAVTTYTYETVQVPVEPNL